jgi:Aspartokinases
LFWIPWGIGQDHF